MSALEQMALFEKRLKTEAKRMPEKEIVPEDDVKVDSNRARSINKQMDWECGSCNTVQSHASLSRVTWPCCSAPAMQAALPRWRSTGGQKMRIDLYWVAASIQ